MMTRRPLLIASLCLSAGLIGGWWYPVLAVPVLVAAVVALVLDWRRVRRETLDHAARQWEPEWSNTWLPLSGDAAELDREWQELGYRPVGSLRDGKRILAVYQHASLAIYACVRTEPGGRAVPFALTFFAGGGAVLTTAAPARESGIRACLGRPGAPRLVQLRVGGRPLALDGQHTGTVKAWTAGKRAPLPATRETLVPQLQADRELLRSELETGQGFTFLDYLRILAGRPRGVLTF